MDVGGKALTNYLKELITHRQWNMMDDTALVNQIKEELCFCAQDYTAELRQCQKDSVPAARIAAFERGQYPGMYREFVLPDYHKIMRGYVKPAPTPATASVTVAAEGAKPAKSTPTPSPPDVAGGGEAGDGDGDGDGDAAASKGKGKGKGKAAKVAKGRKGGKRKGRKAADDDMSDESGEDWSGDSDEDDEDDDDVDIAAIKALEAQAEAERQVLIMNNERIAVPEILFNPVDVGINELGVVGTALRAVASCPPYIRGMLLSNIIVTGGNTCLPGFVNRL